jgi:hypothetical protein
MIWFGDSFEIDPPQSSLTMRPISLLASALIKVLDLTVYLIWFGVCAWGVKYVLETADVTLLFIPLPYLPGGIVVGLFLGYVLRPVRKAGYMLFAKEFARSSSRSLMEIGTWRLLKVAYRFWPQEAVTDFIGFAALHRIYDQAPAARRERLYAVVRQIESSPGCPLAPAAHDFLDEIGEEADTALPAPDNRPSYL